jgi:hypothetical protein
MPEWMIKTADPEANEQLQVREDSEAVIFQLTLPKPIYGNPK